MATRTITYLQISNTGSSNGQVLTSNGTAVYWANSSGGGGFTNGQSISVNNFVVTGAITANSSNGTSGQVLTTNGSAVYWSTVSGGGGGSNAAVITAGASTQSFTGNGSNTVFTLSSSIADDKNIIITLDGLVQIPNTHYSISGTTLTFTDAPLANTVIEARTLNSGADLTINYDTYTANGTQNTFTLGTSFSNQNNALVIINGLVQTPTTDYTISGSTLTLTFTPSSNSFIEVKRLFGGGGAVSNVAASKLFFYGTIIGG